MGSRATSPAAITPVAAPSRCVHAWTRRIKLGPAAEPGWVVTWLPHECELQSIVTPWSAHAVERDELGNRRLRGELAPSSEPVTLELTEEIGVRADRPVIADCAFPLEAPIATAPAWLSATAMVNPHAPAIRTLAAELTSGRTSALAVVLAFARFCHDELRYDNDAMLGAFPDLVALEQRAGSCDEKSHLLVALCRSVGIPAAVIMGRMTDDDGPIGHAWVELTLDGRRWFPVDPTRTPVQIGWTDTDRVKGMRMVDCAQAVVNVIPGSRTAGGARVSWAQRPLAIESAVACTYRGEPRSCPFRVRVERVDHGPQRVAVTAWIGNPTANGAVVTRVELVAHEAVRHVGEAAGDGAVWCVLAPGEYRSMVLVVDLESLGSAPVAARIYLMVDEVALACWTATREDGRIAAVREGDHALATP